MTHFVYRLFFILALPFLAMTSGLADSGADAFELDSIVAQVDQAVADLNITGIDAEVNATLAGIDLDNLDTSTFWNRVIWDSGDLNNILGCEGHVPTCDEFGAKHGYCAYGPQQIDYNGCSPANIKLTLTGGDVVSFGTFFVQNGADWFLYKKLQEDAVNGACDKLLKDHAKLREHMAPVAIDIADKGIKKELVKPLLAYLGQNYSMRLHWRDFITNPSFAKLIAYSAFAEIITLGKNAVFDGSFSPLSLFSSMFNSAAKKEPFGLSVFSLFKMGLGLLYIPSGALPSYFGFTGLSLALSAFGLRSAYCDIHIVQAMKRLVVSLWFMRQLNGLYKKQWIAHVIKNAPTLNDLLKCYDVALQNNATDDLAKVKQEIKAFVQEAHKKSFFFWWRFKLAAFARTDRFIEAVFSYKAYVQLASFLYQFFGG